MASPVSRETTEQKALCPAQKFKKLTQLWILEYLEVKNVVLSYGRLNFDNFQADQNTAFLPFLPSLLFYSEWKFAAEYKYVIKYVTHIFPISEKTGRWR